jgi:hypothetical protein
VRRVEGEGVWERRGGGWRRQGVRGLGGQEEGGVGLANKILNPPQGQHSIARPSSSIAESRGLVADVLQWGPKRPIPVQKEREE